ncbi:MAG: carboxypeptidase regulatory-like domain-containing protein, partial [Gemmatimonadaceae bacterium]|nr:carboxypeptidase regulatory-like domain-containing protein [Gemmatimonadaceae bacterium]
RIRGRVVDDSARVVVGATVFATRAPDRAVKQATTDSTGRYVIAFENGTGDYLVSVSAVGFRTARRRVPVDSVSHEATADFTLARDATTLAAVKVEATKPVKASNDVSPFTAETGASERWADGVSGQLSPAMAGDIAALAATLPGFVSGPGGLSFMGAGAQSNLTTLNGMALPASALPRAARVDTRVTGTTYDPARGGFAGANIDVRLSPGSRSYQDRNAYFTFDSPSLQRTDAIGRATGATKAVARASAGANGELIRQALTYNAAVDLTRSRSDLSTLATADAAALARAGVSPDSVARLASAAQSLGIPLRAAGAPADRERSVVTWLGRLDDIRDTLHLRTLTSLASFTRDGALGLGTLTAPSAGGQRDERVTGAQLQMSDFVGPTHLVLTQTRLAASHTHTSSSPYALLPSANVLVGSFGAEGPDVASLGVGGGAGFASDDARWTLEGANETIWNARGRKHRFKVMLWGRADGVRQATRGALMGSYAYASLADFAANHPSSYARTIVQPERAGTAFNAAAAVAHQFNPTRWFNVLYGLRAEANGFGNRPARNLALEQALGVRSGIAPTRWHVSPRAGFQLTYNRNRDNGNGMSNNQVGTFYRTTSGVVRGGIGEFRDLVRPDLVAGARARTGLPDGAQSIACVGTAVPIPDWQQLIADPASVPSRCADGGGVLAQSSPGVSLIDPHFDAPRSWRASLDWNANHRSLMWRLSGVISYDLNQPGSYDANFAGVPRFALGGADGRPVYVTPASIDAASGLLSSTESRRSAAFSRVDVRTSDLRGLGEQVTATLAPDPFRRNRHRGWLSSLTGSVSYTWQRSQRQARGFDGAGYGDPRRVEWAPASSDARHVVLLQAGAYVPKVGAWTMSSRLQSGLPFTPIVQGDLDGDGRGGDRALVPSAASADSLGAAVRALLTTGSPAARECLTAWAGRVAARNGCRGPWTATLNAQWRPYLPTRIARRVIVSVFFENILGGVDQMLHGSAMRGWGSTSSPDPVLLVPRGFDATSHTYRFALNPRFADTRPANTLLREPFRVTLDVQMRLSVDYNLQQLRRALEPVRIQKRWVRRDADSLASFYLRNTSNIHAALLAESDSLLLNPRQIVALRALDSAYKAQVRALYRPLGVYLSQFSDGQATKAALDSVTATSKAYWKVFWEQPEKADSVITPIQRELMPMLRGMLGVPKPDREHSQWQFGYSLPLVDPKKP